MHLWLLKIICYPVSRNIAIWGGSWRILHTGHCGFLTTARLPETEWTSVSVQRQRDSKMPAIIFNNWGTGRPTLAWYNSKMVDIRVLHIQLAVETNRKVPFIHHGDGIPTIEFRGQVELI